MIFENGKISVKTVATLKVQALKIGSVHRKTVQQLGAMETDGPEVVARKVEVRSYSQLIRVEAFEFFGTRHRCPEGRSSAW